MYYSFSVLMKAKELFFSWLTSNIFIFICNKIQYKILKIVN